MNSPYKRTTYKGKPIDEHRKVMEKYLGRELESWEIVHHINGDKRDNRVENLQVMTQNEHNKLHKEKLPKIKICIECGKEFEPPVKHRGRNQLCSRKCWNKHIKKVSPFQNIAIVSYKDGIKIKEYKSIKEASIDVNGLSTNIVKCLKGKIKTSYGYEWQYLKKC